MSGKRFPPDCSSQSTDLSDSHIFEGFFSSSSGPSDDDDGTNEEQDEERSEPADHAKRKKGECNQIGSPDYLILSEKPEPVWWFIVLDNREFREPMLTKINTLR